MSRPSRVRPPTIRHLGAAGGVTGSCHLLEAAGMRILLDCGYFQGRDSVRKNRARFPFDPRSIDAVFLSHAHLDHCGRIPRLVKEGFRGPIHATSATRDLAEIVMLDAAAIQLHDHEQWRKRRGRGTAPVPLFEEKHVRQAMSQFVNRREYGSRGEVHPGITLEFIDAGHILGSACVRVDVDGAHPTRLIFSGDIGNPGKPIVRDPAVPPVSDFAICESTYGGRQHRDMDSSIAELRSIVTETIERGGKVLIPSFALERTQELLFALFDLWRETRLGGASIYLDSPLAIDATEIFLRHPGLYDEEAEQRLRADPNPFRFPALHYTRRAADSKKINELKGPAVIVAGAGMCTGGRILHHLRNHLPKPETALVIVGYQAEGGLGRRLVDGATEVRVYGSRVPVRASVHTIGGFSAHGDQDDLLGWVRATEASQVSLVHGDPAQLAAFRALLAAEGVDARVPRAGEQYALPVHGVGAEPR